MTKEKNLKFFIVFKDAFSRMLYQQYLHNLGYKNFVLMESCDDCFDKMDLEPDIIFLDFDLYPNDGLEMVKKMKMLNPNVHILIISCPKGKQMVLEALKHGATDYIIKGDYDLEMIRSAVGKIVVKKDFKPQYRTA